MIWVNADDVIAIHGQIIKKSGGSDGLRDHTFHQPPVSSSLKCLTLAARALFNKHLSVL